VLVMYFANGDIFHNSNRKPRRSLAYVTVVEC